MYAIYLSSRVKEEPVLHTRLKLQKENTNRPKYDCPEEQSEQYVGWPSELRNKSWKPECVGSFNMD